MESIQKSEDTEQESVCCLYHVVPRVDIQVANIGNKSLYTWLCCCLKL